jgi:magnesium-protoporphyrin IX monomethyl ester (oxidative) cyclase
MRILLLNPAFTAPKQAGFGLSFPLGLGYLAASLKKAGYDVIGLDAAIEAPPKSISPGQVYFGLTDNQLRNRITEIKPDMVGISCFFSSRFPAVLKSALVIKGINKAIPVIVGGAHPSIMPGDVCAYPDIDFAMIGESELSLVAFLKAYEKHQDFCSIDGLAFKREGRVMVNPKTNFVGNIDELGFPDWDAFDFEKYLTLNRDRWGLGFGRYSPLITSRSCPYHCNFCSVHKVMGARYRARSARHVLQEIELLVTRYNVNEISFEDDNLTYDKRRFIEICRGIKERGIKIRWHTPNGVHVGSLDNEMIEWASQAGCDSLNLAIESGDEHMRNKIIKKGLSTQKIYEVVRSCRKAGIKVNAYFVIGMPGETDQSIDNTRKLIKDLRFDNLSIFAATPIPGTRLYEECLANGYIKPGSFDSDFVTEQATIFTQPVIETPQFDRYKVRRWSHRLADAYNTSLLLNNPLSRLAQNPRSLMAATAKFCLYRILGEKNSMRVVDYIRRSRNIKC